MRHPTSSPSPAFRAALLAGLLALPACSGAYADGTTEAAASLSVAQFEDVPIPDGLKLQTNLNQTYSYENGMYRKGAFVYTGTLAGEAVVEYALQNLPDYGWQLVSNTGSAAEGEGGAVLEFVRWPYRARYQIEDAEKGPTRLEVTYTTDFDSDRGDSGDGR